MAMNNTEFRRALTEVDGSIGFRAVPLVAVDQDGNIYEIQSINWSMLEGGQIHINIDNLD